jgi:hypothetical protein
MTFQALRFEQLIKKVTDVQKISNTMVFKASLK